jgi:uncharacterized protein
MHQHLSPFHVAFPVDDLTKARAFYGGVLGCPEGRSSDVFVGFNLCGHQIVAHLCPRTDASAKQHNVIDSHNLPIPHFGLILPLDDWEKLAHRLRAAHVAFVVEPYVRFQGEIGEQCAMMLLDPAGNALEFKAFSDPSRIFAKE